MCTAARKVCRWWVVRGAPKRMRTTKRTSVGSERERSKEMSDGLKVNCVSTKATRDSADENIL